MENAMMIDKRIGRRDALKISGFGMLAFLLPSFQGDEASPPAAFPKAEAGVTIIGIGNNYASQEWYYDPCAVWVPKGQKVRWVARKWGATVTAFHPSNDNHELRIPEGAKPFDSGIVPLMDTDYKGMDIFEVTLDVEGTYDYYSRHHEILGMVGRIVVGKPGGPAEKPPGYGGRDGRAVVFPAEAKLLNAVPSSEIVAKKAIRFPKNFLARPTVVGPHG
jgi:plastocyanin